MSDDVIVYFEFHKNGKEKGMVVHTSDDKNAKGIYGRVDGVYSDKMYTAKKEDLKVLRKTIDLFFAELLGDD